MIKWNKNGQTYTSTCGRFIISNMSLTSRPKWVLTDTSRRDVCLPQYTWSKTCVSLASAKQKAERILAGRNV